jgi:hypothetical protein
MSYGLSFAGQMLQLSQSKIATQSTCLCEHCLEVLVNAHDSLGNSLTFTMRTAQAYDCYVSYDVIGIAGIGCALQC